MPILLDEPVITTPDELRHKKWTRAELERVEATGVFEGQHWELIDGELINKMGKNWPHTYVLQCLTFALRQVFGYFRVHQEAPIEVAPQDLPTNQPEPDVLVLKHESHQLRGTPSPHNVVLVVEVADSSLGMDTGDKARLYARAGIEDYWVLDVRRRRLLVFRDRAEGRYRTLLEYEESECIAPLASPNQTSVPVHALFGPPVPSSPSDSHEPPPQ